MEEVKGINMTTDSFVEDTKPTEIKTQVETQKPGGFLVSLLSVLLLVSVVIAGFFAYQTQKLVKELQGIKSESLKPSPVASPTVDSKNGWKVYTNLEKDYEVKYPSQLVEDRNGDKLLLYVKGFTPSDTETFVPNITIGNKYTKPTGFIDLLSWAKSNSKIFVNISNENEIKLGDEKFITFESDSGSTAYSIHYLIADNNSIYDFSVRIPGANNETGNILVKFIPQILSTFRFMEPVTDSPLFPNVCTADAKACPDGSYVSRGGPKCEFAACPTPKP